MTRGLALALLLAGPAAAVEYTSWVVYWDADSPVSFDAYRGRLGETAVFGWRFGVDKRLKPATAGTAALIARVRSGGNRAYASALNDLENGAGGIVLKDPGTVHEILSDPVKRAAHLGELEALAASADGLELDYENLWAASRDLYSAFVRDLAARVRPTGRGLAVVVQQKRSGTIRDGAGALDWAALSASADHIKIMGYNQHGEAGPAGPVSSPDWLLQIVAYATTVVPREKIEMVLPLHGFDWPRGARGTAIEHDTAVARAAQYGAAISRDAQGTPYFTYTAGGVVHDVWFDDAVSIAAKVAALRGAGIDKIGLWRLGTGDAALWQSLPLRAEQ